MRNRIHVLIRKCRNRGGDCSCTKRCQAKEEVLVERIEADQALHKAQERVKDAQELLRHLDSPPCTVKPGWKLPEKPKGNYIPAVYFDCDECYMHWYSDTEEIDQVEMELTGGDCWPFVEDRAWREDWERIGFTVVD